MADRFSDICAKAGRLAAGALGLSLALSAVSAGAQTRGVGHVSAVIVPPAAMSAASPLNFGQISSTGGGAVTVSDTGARQAKGQVALVGEEVSTAATVTIAEDGSTAYAIEAPDEVQVGPMKATTRIRETRSQTGRTLVVGAALRVPAGTPPAAYRGDFRVTAVFN